MTIKSGNGFIIATLSAFISTACSQIAGANDRSITFDSRYIQGSDQQQDIRGLMSFGKDTIVLRSIGVDWATDRWGHSNGSRAGVFIGAELLAGFVMDESFLKALHEQSHGSRMAAGGLKYEFDNGEDSFFPYYFSSFGKSGGWTQPIGNPYFQIDDKAAEYIANNGGADHVEVFTSAAGINAEMAYASYLQDQLYFNGAHLSQGLSIILGKASSLKYQVDDDDDGNDLKEIEKAYQNMGIDAETDDLKQANIVALLLSASTWQYFLGISDYVQNGKTELNQWAFHGFRIPEFTSYATTRGISMKMDTGYQFNDDLHLTLGVEHVYKGKSATEYTVGMRKELPVMSGLTLQGHAIMGYGTGYQLHSELSVTDSFSLYAGANYDELDSLNGERYIQSLKDGIKDWSVFGGVRWHY